MYVHNTQNLYLHLDREQPSMKYMIRPFMFVQCTYMLHTNFDIDVICFQLGNGQFQLLMQFCNLFYIRTTTYFLRLLLFFKTWNFPQLTIEKGMLYVQNTSHTGQHKQLGLNKSQGCLKNPNEKHLARILFD